MQEWFVEGWLYIVLMSVAIGIVLGYGSLWAIKFSLRRYVLDLFTHRRFGLTFISGNGSTTRVSCSGPQPSG